MAALEVLKDMPTKDSYGVDRTSTPSSTSTPSTVVSAVGTVTPPDSVGSATVAELPD